MYAISIVSFLSAFSVCPNNRDASADGHAEPEVAFLGPRRRGEGLHQLPGVEVIAIAIYTSVS